MSDKIPICPVSETAILWTKTPGMLRARSAIIFKLEVGQFELSLPVEVNNEKKLIQLNDRYFISASGLSPTI